MIANKDMQGLEESIRSVLNQTYSNLQLIVMVNNMQYINLVMNKFNDSRMIWWNMAKNVEDEHLINYALQHLVDAEYVTYMYSKQKLKPRHIESQYKQVKDKNYIKTNSPNTVNSFIHKFIMMDKIGVWTKERLEDPNSFLRSY